MKKQFIYIIVLLLSIQSINAQSYYCNTNGNTHSALDTYWHYRYRLINYFMRMGSKQGMSIPADRRNSYWGTVPGHQMIWTDGPRTLSWYIETLATEYSLLSYNHQNTDETIMELYYALHALFRMDSAYVGCATQDGGSCTICSGLGSSINFPGYGIMPADDVGSNVNVTLDDPLNAGLTTTTYIGSPAVEYLTTTYTNVPSPYTTIFSGSNAFGLPVVPGGLPVSEVGDGIVGPIDNLQGNDPCSLTVASKDDFMAVLIALAVVKELVPSNVMGFSACSNPYGYNLGPSQMAQGLGTAILHYVWDESQLNLVGCDGHVIANDINQSDFTKYWSWPYYPPFVNVATFFGYSLPTPHPYLPPILATLVDPIIGLTFYYNPSIIWDNATPCTALDLSSDASYCDETTMELEEMGAVMGNDGGPYSSACDLISDYGTWNQGCFLCAGEGSNATGTGQEMYYGALHNLLWGGECSSVDICNMQALVNSAPWDGPYNHSAVSGDSPIDFASCGWASTRRFASNNNNDFNGGSTTFPGNFNGLDYMLFYNLYCIMSQRAYSQPINIPTTCVYPYTYPPSNQVGCSFPANPGTTADPVKLVSYFCEPILVNQLDILNGGGLILQGGVTSYIDMKPNSGPIYVNSGGFLDAYCTYNCCEPNSDSYDFENDPGLSNDRAPKRRKGDSASNNYHMSSEFLPKPNYDAISNYPNPFSGITTFNFEIKETTPVTISIYNISGQKITNLFMNQLYNQGSYAQIFDGSSLAAGTYTAVLLTKDDRKIVQIIKD